MTPTPRWWLLYSVVPLAGTLLTATHFTQLSAGWRQVAQCAIVLVVFGAVWLWLRANRLALALSDQGADAEGSVKGWVAYCPPCAPPPRLGTLEIPPPQDRAA
jgi:hypothetical protein